MKNLMKEAHKMTKKIKAEYPNVDYKFQLGLCISYLSKNKGDVNTMDVETLRIKRMEICKDLKSLKSWIVSDLKSDEIITIYLDQEKEDYFTVEKDTVDEYFIVKVDGELFDLPKYFRTELFSDMFDENISEIEVFHTEVLSK